MSHFTQRVCMILCDAHVSIMMLYVCMYRESKSEREREQK